MEILRCQDSANEVNSRRDTERSRQVFECRAFWTVPDRYQVEARVELCHRLQQQRMILHRGQARHDANHKRPIRDAPGFALLSSGHLVNGAERVLLEKVWDLYDLVWRNTLFNRNQVRNARAVGQDAMGEGRSPAIGDG
jgi:hypothetical protein